MGSVKEGEANAMTRTVADGAWHCCEELGQGVSARGSVDGWMTIWLSGRGGCKL